MHTPSNKSTRRGGVYIAVLGTALIVSVMALSAIGLQRVQHRRLNAALDARQAQLNAQAAIELGLLTIQEDDDWRYTYADTSGSWFTRSTGTGTCSLLVTDPVDGDLDDDPDNPFVLTGVGQSGNAEQRVEMYVDPRTQPADALKAAATAGGIISGRSDVDWNAVVDAYQDIGTEISIGSLPTATPNLGRNVGMESATGGVPDYWIGTPPGIPESQISQVSSFKRSGSYSVRVQNRDQWYSGPAQRIDEYVKPGVQYSIEAWVYLNGIGPRNFHLSLYTKGTGSAVQWVTGAPTTVVLGAFNFGWTRVPATLTAPSWSGDLEYAFVKIAGADTNNTADFYVDDFDIREAVTGRFIYRQVLSSANNPFGSTNPQGIYWINCSGNTIIIERSRILGTLLLLNPGAGSRIANGPVHFAPAAAGYPSLLVQGDFAVRATNRVLSELENGVDYNLDGTNGNYIYPSEIQGLVAVSGNLTFENQPRVRGQVVAGGTITGSPSLQHRLDAVYSPPPGFTGDTAYERRPASIRKVVLP